MRHVARLTAEEMASPPDVTMWAIERAWRAAKIWLRRRAASDSSDSRAAFVDAMRAADATEGTAIPSERDTRRIPPGTYVSRYRILSRIGVGGMGEVYRAVDTRLGRLVAIKLLAASLTADARVRRRFLREARLASALDHPNVCAIYDVGQADDRLFIAMQYVEGSTVKRLVAHGPLDPDRALSIAAQTAAAVTAMHRQGIVHRDVKSSNVVVTPAGHAVVLDFGLAKQIDGSDSLLTRPGTVLGTPSYMSPEQACGEPVDPRSDVFSLGVVLYEMAAGRLPFERRSAVETLTSVVYDPHVPLAEVNPRVPAALSAIVDRALAKLPTDRYPSMEAMRDALRAVDPGRTG